MKLLADEGEREKRETGHEEVAGKQRADAADRDRDQREGIEQPGDAVGSFAGFRLAGGKWLKRQ